VSARITTQLKKYQSILASLQKRDVSEADTVTVINDMLSEICGYDKYLHITSQYAIRGTYVDLAVKVDEEIRFLIEVKASNSRMPMSNRRSTMLPTKASSGSF
jgi:hypothetical protein